MCYSAKVYEDYRYYQRHFDADIEFEAFVRLIQRRNAGERIVLPRGFTDAFKQEKLSSPEEQECRDLVLDYEAQLPARLEEELAAQRARQAVAQERLQVKVTKTAQEELRKAANALAKLQARLEDLSRTAPRERDDRIFSGSYCPVMVFEDGQYVVRPMRYLCRPAGVPPSWEIERPGVYNARRNSLPTVWRGQFRKTHAIVAADAFFENVKRHRLEQRELAAGEKEQNVVLRFAPSTHEVLHLACIWSHWTSPNGDETLDSFALVTDEPPAEVAAAGHDRCPIPVKATNLQAWLTPGAPAQEYEAILDDKVEPYYEYEES